jgi:hypothetical protein
VLLKLLRLPFPNNNQKSSSILLGEQLQKGTDDEIWCNILQEKTRQIQTSPATRLFRRYSAALATHGTVSFNV